MAQDSSGNALLRLLHRHAFVSFASVRFSENETAFA
jgi:hypothetical protein